MKDILVFTQDTQVFNLVAETLKRDDFKCVLAKSASDLFRMLENSGNTLPEMVILDLDVFDDVSGWDVCKVIKKDNHTRNIPVIMITGSYKTSTDVVFGFQHGIDDYMIKPFNPNILLARIKAILRRSVTVSVPRKENLISADKRISVDMEKRLVYLSDRKKGKTTRSVADSFTPKEFDLLCLFLRKSNQVITRSVIAETVWGQGFFDTSRTIDKHIETLRRKLGVFGTRIVSVSRVGYKFIDK
jgi:two-component system alkaline phosphatase synthesis response regulator PhoP